MKILVSGSSGFLGQNLIKSILEETNHSIIALSSHKAKLEKYINDYPDRITVFNTSGFVSLPFEEIDVLINCAFPMKADGVQMADGLRFIAALLRTTCHNGIGAVVNISSQSVYSSKRQKPATEESELDLECSYGMGSYAVGKYAVELLTNSICNNIPHTNLRLASLIGAGYDQRVINKLIDKALCGEELIVLSGPQYYGFLDVRDAADAITAVINSDPMSWSEVYNLGTNESYTLEDIVKTVVEIYNQEFSANITYKTELSEKHFNSVLSCRKFNEDFHWSPRYSLIDTIQWIFEQKRAK